MVPQIIFIILQVIAILMTVIKDLKTKNYINIFWYIVGIVVTNILLYSGNFYDPFFN